MKKSQKAKLVMVAQNLHAIMYHMRFEASRYPMEEGKRDMNELLEQLPKEKGFKKYNDRMEKAVEACSNKYGLTMGYDEISNILFELL